MKTAKIVIFALALFTAISFVCQYIVPALTPEPAAIGVIGSADGPAAIFVAAKFHSAFPIFLQILFFVLLIAAGIVLRLKSRNK